MSLDRLDPRSSPHGEAPLPAADAKTVVQTDLRPQWERVVEVAQMQNARKVAASPAEQREHARGILLDAFETFAATGDSSMARTVLGPHWRLEAMKTRKLFEAVLRYYHTHDLGRVGLKTLQHFEDLRSSGVVTRGLVAFEDLARDLAKSETLIGTPSVEKALVAYHNALSASGVDHYAIRCALLGAKAIVAPEMVRLARATFLVGGLEQRHLIEAASAISKYGSLAGLPQSEVLAILGPFASAIDAALREGVECFKLTPSSILARWFDGGSATIESLYRALRHGAYVGKP